MKFSVKMILMVALILALTLSIGGYMIIWTSFESQIQSEIQMAQDEVQTFSFFLQALEDQYPENPLPVEQVLKKELNRSGLQMTHDFAISDDFGNCIICTDAMHTPIQSYQDFTGIIRSDLIRENGFYIVSVVSLLFSDQTLQLQMERDVTSYFNQAHENLRTFQIIMVILLIISVLITAGFTLFLTKPLNDVAQSATELAQGHYEKRVAVSSHDEVGQVARSFNGMADALEAKILELDDALSRQKDFTASFAHELKTPLTSVIGYADTLRSRILPPERQIEAATYIVTEGKRLEAMSHALLELFELEDHSPGFTSVSVSQIFEKVKVSCDYFLTQHGVRLEIEGQDAELDLVPELVHTLLYNLIDNACKASPEGSTIQVTGRQTDAGYTISVQDHGRGIPQKVLNRITEPFYMVDKSRARAQGGAGLGLALCSRIAQIHGTTLLFQSIPGEGTTVTFLLGGKSE